MNIDTSTRKPLLFALDKNLEIGKAIYCKANDFNPEFIIFHPDDFENVQRAVHPRELLHIRYEPHEDAMERIRKYYKPVFFSPFGPPA